MMLSFSKNSRRIRLFLNGHSPDAVQHLNEAIEAFRRTMICARIVAKYQENSKQMNFTLSRMARGQ